MDVCILADRKGVLFNGFGWFPRPDARVVCHLGHHLSGAFIYTNNPNG